MKSSSEMGKPLATQPAETGGEAPDLQPGLVATELDMLIAIFDGTLDPYTEGDEDEGLDLEELFRRQIVLAAPDDNFSDLVECGSTGRHAGKPRVKNTPHGLYRLLYLVQPKAVDFSDMYNSEVFSFRSADRRFGVMVYLFKYELGLYFYCRQELAEGNGRAVWAGMPGANNGTKCKDATGRKFFEMAAKAARHKWMVYGGNDFAV